MKKRYIETTNHYLTVTKPLLYKLEKSGLETREELVQLLREVQVGYLSCERVADILMEPQCTK
jgi:hypothetical protein